MFNFLGVSCNLSVLAGVPAKSTFRFLESESGEAACLDGVTFLGRVHCGELEVEMELTLSEADAERNTVLVTIPGLPEGRWEYEVWLSVDTGEVVRLLEGRISALGKFVPVEGGPYAQRTLSVLLPGDVTRRVKLVWSATTIAEELIEESRRIARNVRDASAHIDAVMPLLDGVVERVDVARAVAEQAAKDCRMMVATCRMVSVGHLPAVEEAESGVVYFMEGQPWIAADGVWVQVPFVYGAARPGGSYGLLQVELFSEPGRPWLEVRFDADSEVYGVDPGDDFMWGVQGRVLVKRARADIAGLVRAEGTEEEQAALSDDVERVLSVPSVELVNERIREAKEAIEDGLQEKLEADLSNLAPEVDVVVGFNAWEDGSWCRRWRSGWVEQGGEVTAEEANPIVTLPVAMGSVSYHLLLTTRSNTLQGAHYGAEMPQGRSADRFQARCEAGGQFTWRVEGVGAVAS